MFSKTSKILCSADRAWSKKIFGQVPSHVIIIIMEVHREWWRHHQWHQRWERSPRFDAQMQAHWRHLTAVLGSVLLFLKILNVLMGGNSPGAVICRKLGFPIQHFCVGGDSIFPRDAHDLAKAAEVKLIEFGNRGRPLWFKE